MALITRQGKGSKLTIQEMDNNLLYLEEGGLSRNPIIRSFQYAGKDPDKWIELLGEGIVLSSDEVDGPDDRFYGIASFETWVRIFSTPIGSIVEDGSPYYKGLKDLETFMSVNKIKSIPTSYFSSVETYAKSGEFTEQFFNSQFYNYNQPIRKTNSEPNPSSTNQFFQTSGEGVENSIAFKTAKDKYSPYRSSLFEMYDRVLDKGVIEKGRILNTSQISVYWDLFYKRGGTIWPSGSSDSFDRILDWGLFMVNFDKGGRLGLFEETNGTQKPQGVFVGNIRGLRKRAFTTAAVPA